MEEIAIDRDLEEEKLNEAQILHLDSLILAKYVLCSRDIKLCKPFVELPKLYALLPFPRQAFGEDNVQIAKHFGNLGRLYQSMRRYDVS